MKNDEELSREFQKEHGKAMGKYDRAYQSTKKEVLDKTHHFARISRKGMLLGIIGFLIILYIFVASALSGGSLEKIIRRRRRVIFRLTILFSGVPIPMNMWNRRCRC